MKFLKMSILILIVTFVFAGMVDASNSNSYSFITVSFPAKKSTYTESNMGKLENNHQYLENYSTSQATVDAELYTVSLVDLSYSHFVGASLETDDIDPNEIAKVSQESTLTTAEIFGRLEGVYNLTLTKKTTLLQKGFGGAWWLDKSYYDATH